MSLGVNLRDLGQGLEFSFHLFHIDLEKIGVQIDLRSLDEFDFIDDGIGIEVDHLQTEIWIVVERVLDSLPASPANTGNDGEDAGKLGQAASHPKGAKPSDARRHHAHFQHLGVRAAAGSGSVAFEHVRLGVEGKAQR